MPSEGPRWIGTDGSPGRDATSIAFILVENFSMISFATAIEPIYLANQVSGRNLYSYAILSESGGKCRASNGIEIETTGCFAKAQDVDVVVVCGGPGINQLDHKTLQNFLRRIRSRGASIGAVHSGTYVLVKSGLLDGYRATIHWEQSSSVCTDDRDFDLVSNIYEIDRNRFTCAGGIATADMMLTIILRDHGFKVAAEVADHLVHRHIRPETDQQRMALGQRIGVSHPKILRVVGLMESHLSEPLSSAELAEAVELSTRHLERLFLKHTGLSPSKYYMNLRLEHAQSLIVQTMIPILSVALESGFTSASHFSKSYFNHFGRQPSSDRKIKSLDGC